MSRRNVYGYLDTTVTIQPRVVTSIYDENISLAQFKVYFEYWSQFKSDSFLFSIEYLYNNSWDSPIINTITNQSKESGYKGEYIYSFTTLLKSNGLFRIKVGATNKHYKSNNIIWSEYVYIVKDEECNIYNTHMFGNKLWTIEPLRSQLDNSTSNSLANDTYEIVDNNDWGYGFTYDSKTALHVDNSFEYGHKTRGICPNNCYIPSDAELNELGEYFTTHILSNDTLGDTFPYFRNTMMTSTFPQEPMSGNIYNLYYVNLWKIFLEAERLSIRSICIGSTAHINAPVNACIYCVIDYDPKYIKLYPNLLVTAPNDEDDITLWNSLCLPDIHPQAKLYCSYRTNCTNNIKVRTEEYIENTHVWQAENYLDLNVWENDVNYIEEFLVNSQDLSSAIKRYRIESLEDEGIIYSNWCYCLLYYTNNGFHYANLADYNGTLWTIEDIYIEDFTTYSKTNVSLNNNTSLRYAPECYINMYNIKACLSIVNDYIPTFNIPTVSQYNNLLSYLGATNSINKITGSSILERFNEVVSNNIIQYNWQHCDIVNTAGNPIQQNNSNFNLIPTGYYTGSSYTESSKYQYCALATRDLSIGGYNYKTPIIRYNSNVLNISDESTSKPRVLRICRSLPQ